MNITSKYVEAGGSVDAQALASWVSSSLVVVGADSVDIQAFSDPVSGATGCNVIGTIYGTGRMANQEAFVVATDVIQSRLLPAPDLPAALALHPFAAMLRIASILSHAKWLAKDAVFVVSVFSDDSWRVRSGVDGTHPGLEAWARHALDGKDAFTVMHHHGLVRGALCLDWDPDALRNAIVLIRAPAPWGRLPDMDILTLVLLSSGPASGRDVVVTAADDGCNYSQSHSGLLVGLLNFMADIAFGPYGPHSVFLSRNIDGFTISVNPRCAVERHFVRTAPDTMRHLVAGVETFAAGMNAVEEKLHAAFYFYFLPSAGFFVSFGEYIYAGGLTMVIAGLAIVLGLDVKRDDVLCGITSSLRLFVPLVLSFGAATLVVPFSVPPSVPAVNLLSALCASYLMVTVVAVVWVRKARVTLHSSTVVWYMIVYTVAFIPYGMKNYPVMLFASLLTTPALLAVAVSLRYPSRVSVYAARVVSSVLLLPVVLFALLLTRLAPTRLDQMVLAVVANTNALAVVFVALLLPVQACLMCTAWQHDGEKVKTD